MYKTIKKFRNSGFFKRTNIFEKFRRKSEDWQYLLSIIRRYPDIFEPHLLALYLFYLFFFFFGGGGGTNISSAKCYFLCLAISLCLSVSASVCYILRLYKGYLPGTKGYVIYSSGTAPGATFIKQFLFRFSKAMQEKNSFQLLRPAFPSFFSLSSFILFFSHKSRFCVSRCKGGMLRARPLLLHFRVPPPHPAFSPPPLESLGALIRVQFRRT